MYWLLKLWHSISQNDKYVTYATLILTHTIIFVIRRLLYKHRMTAINFKNLKQNLNNVKFDVGICNWLR